MRDTVTLAIALLGAVLGIINVWRALDRDRVRVRVLPRGYVTSQGESGMCVEVVNVGYLPITISQMGFDLRGGGQIWQHAALIKELPKRMEPRTAFTAYLPAGEEEKPAAAAFTRAFAKTACGCRFTGNSPYLRSVIEAARATAENPSRRG